MKNSHSISIPFGWLLLIILLFFPTGTMAMDAADAPTSVTIDYLQKLYEAVEFDHQMHSETYACNACHHHTTGDGPKNENCGKCHADSTASADVSCSGCHQIKDKAPLPLAGQTEDNLYHIDKPGIKGALHLQCLGCHEKEDGPAGCQDCHAFTPEGKKRFAVITKP